MKGKGIVEALSVVVCFLVLSASTVWAEPCLADYNCDGKVSAKDFGILKNEFGRDDCPLEPGSGTGDTDGDGASAVYDNCPEHPNGSYLGTCVKTIGGIIASYRVGEQGDFITCTSDADCEETGGSCQMEQGDCNANGWGDVCECYTDGNEDGKVSAKDYSLLKSEFGRGDCPACVIDGVVLEALDTNAHLGDGWGRVTVSMYNPDHKVKGIQVDLVDDGNDLTCTRCSPDPDRAAQFICSANEQESGCCKVTLFTTDALISEGEGPLFTVDYTIYEDGPAGGCVDLTIENSSVSDESNNPLCVYTVGGEMCFLACGDVYPRECLPESPLCGDGVVNIWDELEVIDIALGIVEPSDCQRMRADVPTGTPPYCTAPDGEINELDVLVIQDMARSRMNCCDYYYFGKIY